MMIDSSGVAPVRHPPAELQSAAVTSGGDLIFLPPSDPEPGDYSAVDFSITRDAGRAVAAGIPANTTRAYKRAWKRFEDWCQGTGRVALPATPHTLTQYVHAMTEACAAPATIDQAVGIIRAKHRQAGHTGQPDTEGALKTLRGYKLKLAKAGYRVRKRDPLSPDDMATMIDACDPATPAGLRDRAILLLGYSIMGRRSELSELDIPDIIEVAGKGVRVFIASSKTDKAVEGAGVAVPFGEPESACPVRAVRAWIEYLAGRGFATGPLFRPVDQKGRVGGEPGKTGTPCDRLTGRAINDIIRQRAQLARIKSANVGGHSIRSGGATAAYDAGAYITSLARQGRWTEKSGTLLGYIRGVDDWEDNAMKNVRIVKKNKKERNNEP